MDITEFIRSLSELPVPIILFLLVDLLIIVGFLSFLVINFKEVSQGIARILGHKIENEKSDTKATADEIESVYENTVVQHEIMLLKSMVASDEDAMIVCNKKGIIVAINRHAENITGYTYDELFGCTINVLMDTKVSKLHDSYIIDYLFNRKEGKSRIIGKERLESIKDKNGNFVCVNLRISEIRNGHIFFSARIKKLFPDCPNACNKERLCLFQETKKRLALETDSIQEEQEKQLLIAPPTHLK